jgi:hypothetical protein
VLDFLGVIRIAALTFDISAPKGSQRQRRQRAEFALEIQLAERAHIYRHAREGAQWPPDRFRDSYRVVCAPGEGGPARCGNAVSDAPLLDKPAEEIRSARHGNGPLHETIEDNRKQRLKIIASNDRR